MSTGTMGAPFPLTLHAEARARAPATCTDRAETVNFVNFTPIAQPKARVFP
jgi:hypothetical protein